MKPIRFGMVAGGLAVLGLVFVAVLNDQGRPASMPPISPENRGR